MFSLAAPYPGFETVTVLPSPKFSDSEALADEVIVQYASDGTRYTWIKTKEDRRKLQWQFKLSRNKALELVDFLKEFFATEMQIVDHKSQVWIGHLINNPFDFTTQGKWGPPQQGWPVGEAINITLEFEGVKQ